MASKLQSAVKTAIAKLGANHSVVTKYKHKGKKPIPLHLRPKTEKKPPRDKGPMPESIKNLGRVIYIYNEVYTNQVIYSLYRTMRDHQGRKQLAYVGKQSVPAALRKDRWSPLACVHLPTPQFGLNTFRLLREFRKLHETQYSSEILKLRKLNSRRTRFQDPKAKEVTGIDRKAKLQDQKANSVVDLAEALKLELDAALHDSEKKNKVFFPKDPEIRIRWQDVRDWEYAASWPEEVKHEKGARPDRYAFAKADLPEDMRTDKDLRKEDREEAKKAAEQMPEMMVIESKDPREAAAVVDGKVAL